MYLQGGPKKSVISNQLEKLEAAKAAWLAVQYNTVQYSTVQYSTVQYSIILQVVSDTFHREHAAFNLLFEATTLKKF